MRYQLTDNEWAAIKPFLPDKHLDQLRALSDTIQEFRDLTLKLATNLSAILK
jgi:transposase